MKGGHRRVHSNLSMRLDQYPSPLAYGGHFNPPPCRQKFLYRRKVLLTNNKCRSIHCMRISLYLSRQAVKSIGVALKFVAVEETIHYRYVDAAQSML